VTPEPPAEPPSDPPSEPAPITPLTALRVDEDGRLTYMGQDGQRYVIVGDAELLRRLRPEDFDVGDDDL